MSLSIGGQQLLSSEGTTQGDPLAMAMYSVSVTPLIGALCESRIRQVWFADDAAAGGTLAGLREWWNRIQDTGAAFGYYLNAAKTNLFVKPEFLAAAQELFLGTGVNVTVEGVCHLEAVLGSHSFTEAYVTERVGSWLNCVQRLSGIIKVHPHAAYSAFVHGRWTY